MPSAAAVAARPALERRERETARLLAGPLDRLNFGCGPHPLHGWTNIDNGDGEWYDAPEASEVIKLDIFEALDALPDGVASCITSEHLFEHFTLEQGHDILHHWFRVLRPGGVLRIVCPDLEAEAELFLRQITPASDEVIDRHRLRWLGDRYAFRPGEQLTRAMVLNYGMRLDGHKFVYDEETLRQSMRLAGFASIARETFGHSTHPALHRIDLHDGGDTGRAWVPGMALVMEGTKAGNAPTPLQTPAPVRPAQAGEAPPDPAAGLKRRLVELTADLCAARGYRRIALYGAGQHTAPIVREPWLARGVLVVAILDDAPRVESISGVRVCTPSHLRERVDAIVVSSDAHEQVIASRAAAAFPSTPVLRIYAEE
jgi:predicted SAM-dependent methyltransferase